MTDYVEIPGIYRAQTDAAVLIELDRGRQTWVPKKALEPGTCPPVGGGGGLEKNVTLHVAAWFVDKYQGRFFK